MMNFTSTSHSHHHHHHRNPVLRAGLKGSPFASSFILRPELVGITNGHSNSNNNNNNGGSSSNSSLNSNTQSVGANTFLTISKSRVPDIQMINKYYGLVPKKFVMNTRSDYSSKQSTNKLQRARTAQSFNEESCTSAGFTDGIMLNSKNTFKEFQDDSQLHFKHRRSSAAATAAAAAVSSSSSDEKDNNDKDNQHCHHHHHHHHHHQQTEREREVELVARKIPVEKHKKWKRIKDCGRSLSMMDNCDHMMGGLCTRKFDGEGSTTTSHHKNCSHYSEKQPDIQRVIKIDLNNMRWEESYKPKSASSAAPPSPIISASSSLQIETDKLLSSPESLSPTPQSPVLYNGNQVEQQDTVTISSGGGNSSKNGGGGGGNGSAARRKGFLRKTISFDEQIMRNSVNSENSQQPQTNGTSATSNKSDNKEGQEISKPLRRPMTAGGARAFTTTNNTQSSSLSSPAASSQSSSSSQSQTQGKISPWTNRVVGPTDRRSKFQKSFSIYSDSMDGGAESENEQEFSEFSNNLSSSSSSSLSTAVGQSGQRYRESRKSLHVQPPPEVSTMISLMSPPPENNSENEENRQSEMDKVALILNTVQDKISQVDDRKLTPDVEEEEDEDEGQKMGEDMKHPNSTIITLTTTTTTMTTTKECEPPQKQVQMDNNNIIRPDVSDKSPQLLPVPTPAAALATDFPPPSIILSRQGRKPLMKAASISCETELFPPSMSDDTNEVSVTKKIRPQTSKARSTVVSFSSTTSTRLIPSRSIAIGHTSSSYPSSSTSNSGKSSSDATPFFPTETLQSQASKNRKILIKKALIEINQSSFNLGKKFSHGRPKTAPTLDVNNKKGSGSVNGGGGGSQKRQPLKASSPPIKMASVLRKNSTLNAKMDSTKNSSKEASPEPESSPPKVRVLPPRQSSFNSEGFLVAGFPSLELGHNNEGDVDDLMAKDAAASFLNSQKREQCLKIYEKMMKKGCAVKLETIFRGMMTPSEYRLFLQATEMAEKNANITDDTIENVNPGGDAGVSTISESESTKNE